MTERERFKKIMHKCFPSVARFMAENPDLHYSFSEKDFRKFWQASAREQMELCRKLFDALKGLYDCDDCDDKQAKTAYAAAIDAMESFEREAGKP